MPAESYVIPLRKAYDKPRTKRANVAVGLVYDFLRKHTRKEKENVILSGEVNEYLWKNSIRYPPRKIEVSLKFDKDLIYVFLKDSDAFKNFDSNKAKEIKKKQSVKEKLEEVRDSMNSPKTATKETTKSDEKPKTTKTVKKIETKTDKKEETKEEKPKVEKVAKKTETEEKPKEENK